MAVADARHILVDNEKKCQELLNAINDGEHFEALAKVHSLCSSKDKGGSLGTFSPGKMVKAFDEVVFNADIGVIYGPVKTEFGYHLIEVTYRG
ncbi:peptidylprolyl isomerase [Sulfurimonas sp. MAG313]|nr:peptidylprolyl isomerase [Sulfurimonas sp. MAG313]MDF1879978.1 peptidylprolyl isomerase [Sulfurimonas sp. MAG313]